MPILHQYQDKSGYFVRTSIQKIIVTYQLTVGGARRLLEAGVRTETKFHRAQLYELYRSGDAYTHGSGPGKIEPTSAGQLDLDFTNDPEPETIFPKCSSCASLTDLHLVEIKDSQKHAVGLYCPSCRGKNSQIVDTSIPIWLVTRGVFEKVVEKKSIKDIDANAALFKGFLDRAFQEKWELLLVQKIRTKDDKQELLFDSEEKQRKLI